MIKSFLSFLWKTVVCAALLTLIISIFSKDFEVWVFTNIAMPFRSVMSSVTYYLPFSIFEILAVLVIPIAAVSLIRLLKKRGRLGSLLFLLQFLLVGYVFSSAVGMNYTVEEKAVLSVGDYEQSARLLADRLNNDVEFISDTHTLDSASLEDEVRNFAREEFDITPSVLPRVKSSFSPSFMTRSGMLAYYAFPTAEIIVNDKQPQIIMPSTVAHEYMHFLGVDGESEANYLAYLSLENSDNPFFRFCANLTAFSYVGGELYKENKDKYFEIVNKMTTRVKYFLEQRNTFINQLNGENVLNSMSEKLNGIVNKIEGDSDYSKTSVYIVSHITGG